MVTKNQRSFYTELHDRLSEVYQLKFKQREDLVAFYSDYKNLFNSIKVRHTEIEKIESDFPEIFIASEKEFKKMTDVLRSMFKLGEKMADYATSSIKADELISQLMNVIIDCRTQMREGNLTIKQVDEKLGEIEQRIDNLKTEVKNLESQFSVLVADNENTKKYYYKDLN